MMQGITQVAVTVVMMALLNSSALGQLLYENFDYPAGNELSHHGWTQISSGTNPIVVTTPGLKYDGYALSGIGNAALLPQNSGEVMKSFTEQTGGSVYVSLMVNVGDAAVFPGKVFLYLGPKNTGIFNRTVSLYLHKKENGFLRFGILKSSGGGIQYVDKEYAVNTTMLIVFKYHFNPGDVDVVSLWINPAIGGHEPNPDATTSTGDDVDGFNEIVLSQINEQPTMTVDGLIVSTTWPLATTGLGATGYSSAEDFRLAQNYPNPFNAATRISYSLRESATVTLTVFDCSGREVCRLVERPQAAGNYWVDFAAGTAPSGVYFYKLTAGNGYSETRKMLIIK